MGRLSLVNLEEEFYACKYCRTELALASQILSQGFTVRGRRAYLFLKPVNVTEGEEMKGLFPEEVWPLVDVFCVRCGSIVGRKIYVAAGPLNFYERKFLLERFQRGLFGAVAPAPR